MFSGDASAAVCELVAGAAQRGARRRLYLRRLHAGLQVARWEGDVDSDRQCCVVGIFVKGPDLESLIRIHVRDLEFLSYNTSSKNELIQKLDIQ